MKLRTRPSQTEQVRKGVYACPLAKRLWLITLLAILALAGSETLPAPTALKAAGPANNPVTSQAGSPIIAWEYDQIQPAMAYGSQWGEYLVVWEDHHWDWGDDWDIYGRRVGADGVALGEHFGISWEGSNHRLSPDVAYNCGANEFLVVWEYEYSATDHDIYARRVASDGSLIGAELAVAMFTNFESNPGVTYNSNADEYLVVWEHREGSGDFTQNDIYGQRLSAEGTPLGNPIVIANGPLNESAPAVAYGSLDGPYLVAWQAIQPKSGEYDIHGRALGYDGTPVGSEIAISTWEYDQLKPRLAFNGEANQFLVVWEDHHWGWGGNWDIYGQRVNADGALDGANFAISWEDHRLEDDRVNPDVAYSPDTDEYRVAWGYALEVDDHYIGHRRLESDGTLIEGETVFSAQSNQVVQLALAAGSQGRYVIVWEDGRDAATQGVDLYADLLDLAGPGLDLQVEHVELTQAIQCKDNTSCPDNAVPLISGKYTYVRVYVKVLWSNMDVPNVSARVVAKVSGVDHVAVPLNSTVTAKLNPQRSQFNDTLNFVLPGYMVFSSGTLEVEVNHDQAIPEANYANNKKTETLTFYSTPTLNVVPVRIDYKSKVVDWTMPYHMKEYLENILPVGEVQLHVLPGPPLPWTQQIGPDTASWGKVLAKLADMKNKNTSGPADAHWYALLPFKEVEGIAGLGATPGKVAMGRVPLHHENMEDAADIMAHELGHNFNRQHAPCGVSDPDPNYPYQNAHLGDFGWDPQGAGGDKVQSLPGGWVVPASSFDVMSYCQDEWISEYTYQAILAYRGYSPLPAGASATASQTAEQGQPRQSAGEVQPYLFASGTVNGGYVELAPWSILDRPVGFDDERGEGEYRLRLVADSGETLFERHFDLETYMPSWPPGQSPLQTEGEVFSFYELLPWYPETVRIEVWHGTSQLAERSVSERPPMVELLSPRGGEVWSSNGEYVIEWQAEDEDGDPLWFDVAFSRDDGATWDIVATGLEETRLEIRGDQFPGTEGAIVRVFASDGVLTAEATSGPLNVEPKPPQAIIAAPHAGATLLPGTPLLLKGYAYDREDGMLGGGAMSWNSDQDGFLGTGSQVSTELSAGPHIITLTVTDSDNDTGMATVNVFVGHKVYLPLSLRNFQ